MNNAKKEQLVKDLKRIIIGLLDGADSIIKDLQICHKETLQVASSPEIAGLGLGAFNKYMEEQGRNPNFVFSDINDKEKSKISGYHITPRVRKYPKNGEYIDWSRFVATRYVCGSVDYCVGSFMELWLQDEIVGDLEGTNGKITTEEGNSTWVDIINQVEAHYSTK